MQRARLPLTLLLLVFCLPAFPAPDVFDLNSTCEKLVKSLQSLTPATRQAASLNRKHRFIPWVGTAEEIISPGQSLDPAYARAIVSRLEDVQNLLIQLRETGGSLPSGLRARLMESVARATSAYYSSLNIPHSVEQFKNVLGQRLWRIKVSPQSDLTSPIVEMANRLSSANVSLQIDFNLLTSNRGAAAFEEGSDTLSPVFNSALFFLHNGLLNDPRDHSRLTLPFRMTYFPDAVNSSVGVLHELRHLENSLRKLERQDFPFYGAVLFPFGLRGFFDKEPEKSSLFTKIYDRFFSLDENDTMLENFFNLGRIIDDSMASFNREFGEDSLEREFKIDMQYVTMANKLSFAIGAAVLSQLQNKDPEKLIEFSEKSGLVWAKMYSALKSEVFKCGFILTIPLVKVKPAQSREEKVQALHDQMMLMMRDLQNRAKFVEWLHMAGDLRHSLEFENKSYKDFLRVFLSALIHPGFSNQPDFIPLSWDRQSRAFRRASFLSLED